LGITDRVLADHEKRKDPEGVTWFTEDDLQRMSIGMALMSAMQDVQHILRSRRSDKVVECGGRMDRFSVRDTG